MTHLPELLGELEERLRAQGAPVVDKLAPGADSEVVAGTLEATVGAAPVAVVEWFAWHDGVDRDRERGGKATHSTIMGYFPYSFSSAVEHNRRYIAPSGDAPMGGCRSSRTVAAGTSSSIVGRQTCRAPS